MNAFNITHSYYTQLIILGILHNIFCITIILYTILSARHMFVFSLSLSLVLFKIDVLSLFSSSIHSTFTFFPDIDENINNQKKLINAIKLIRYCSGMIENVIDCAGTHTGLELESKEKQKVRFLQMTHTQITSLRVYSFLLSFQGKSSSKTNKLTHPILHQQIINPNIMDIPLYGGNK